MTEQQPRQKRILNTKIDCNNSIMVDWMLLTAVIKRQHLPFWQPSSLKK